MDQPQGPSSLTPPPLSQEPLSSLMSPLSGHDSVSGSLELVPRTAFPGRWWYIYEWLINLPIGEILVSGNETNMILYIADAIWCTCQISHWIICWSEIILWLAKWLNVRFLLQLNYIHHWRTSLLPPWKRYTISTKRGRSDHLCCLTEACPRVHSPEDR